MLFHFIVVILWLHTKHDNKLIAMQATLSYACGISDIPLKGETIGQNLRQIAAKFPERTALISEYQQYRANYSEFLAQVEQVAKALMAHGIRRGDRVIVMAGIDDPGPLLHETGSRYDVVDTLIFNDHHTYRVSDIRKMEQLLSMYEDAVIVTTEKDAVKLTNRSRIPETVQRKLYYVPVQVSFVGDSEAEFLRQIELYVRTNQKYSVLHPE